MQRVFKSKYEIKINFTINNGNKSCQQKVVFASECLDTVNHSQQIYILFKHLLNRNSGCHLISMLPLVPQILIFYYTHLSELWFVNNPMKSKHFVIGIIASWAGSSKCISLILKSKTTWRIFDAALLYGHQQKSFNSYRFFFPSRHKNIKIVMVLEMFF